MGIRICERFSSSLWGLEFLNVFLFFRGIRISKFLLGFFGGIRNFESYNNKVRKQFWRKTSLFDVSEKKLVDITDYPFSSLQFIHIFRNNKIVH